jgi:drug/metabolite transporter (DMT)-like permease
MVAAAAMTSSFCHSGAKSQFRRVGMESSGMSAWDGEEGAAIPKHQHTGVTLLPVLASAIASVVTGTALVATRFMVPVADGLTIAMLRYVIAAACLLPFVALFGRMNVTRRDYLPIAGLGILYFCFFPWCISAVMEFTTSSGGAIVLACTPAVTLLLGQLTATEQWSVGKGCGVGVAILGAITAIGNGGFRFGGMTWRGDALMVVATILGAIYAIFSRPYLRKYSPLIVTSIAMATGAVGLLVLWALSDYSRGIPQLDATGWAAILYIGIAGGALSFFLYAWAVGQMGATNTMIMLPLNPIAALIAGAYFLKEPLSLELFVGLALVVIGIILVVGVNGTAPRRMASGVGP